MQTGCDVPRDSFESDVEPEEWKRVLSNAHGHRFIDHTDECWYWQTNDDMAEVALVPMPPSAVTLSEASAYGVKDICKEAAICCAKANVDVREVLCTVVASAPAHATKERRSIEKAYSKMAVMVGVDMDGYDAVFVVDDVLSSGAHFKTAKNYLRAAYGIEAKGIFLTRTPARNNQPALDFWEWRTAQDKKDAMPIERKGILARIPQAFGYTLKSATKLIL